MNNDFIIIHFPKDIMVKNKYITIIGKLIEFNFNLNYILVFTDVGSRKRYFCNDINNNLIEYLNRYHCFNKFEPILDDKIHNFKVIGSILRYNPNNNKENQYIPYNEKIKINQDNQFIYQKKNKINNYLNKFNEENIIDEINNLKNLLNNEVNKNKNLSEQIKLLKLELIEEKNKNKIIEKTGKKLKMELENEIKKNKELTEKMSNLEIDNHQNEKLKENLFKIISNKDEEIKVIIVRKLFIQIVL